MSDIQYDRGFFRLPVQLWHSNLLATRNLVDAMRQMSAMPTDISCSARWPGAARPELCRLPAVMASVGYLSLGAERPYNYMYEPPVGTARQNCEYVFFPVRIENARASASPPRIQMEGFELWDSPISMIDFSDEDAVKSRYHGEAAELAKFVTGADRAFVFDHQIRCREEGRPALSFGRDGDGTRPAAVGRVHNDYSESSGQRRFEIVFPDQKARSDVNRFAIINIWRSIGGTILDTPLALCDAQTVSAADLVVSDLIYPNRHGEIFLVKQSSQHRWSYFPEMNDSEALVFKQYDSQVSGVARFTPHSAFDLPSIPLNAPLRRSIEVRCLVTYE